MYFPIFHELCELVGHGDSQGGDEDGVKKERGGRCQKRGRA